MNTLKKLRERYKNQKPLFTELEETIAANNLRLLHAVLLIATFLFFAMFFMTFVLPDCHSLRYAYILAGAIFFLLYRLYHLPQMQPYSLPTLYIFGILLFVYTAYISLAFHPDQMASALIGVFCLVPLCILDHPWRVNLTTFLFYLLHTVLAFIYKSPHIAMEDMMNVACFAITGVVLGEYMRFLRLDNLNLLVKEKSLRESDFLTGLSNRHKLLSTDFFSDSEDTFPLTGIILLDIDHFQEFNDSFGQPAGDGCIQKIGTFLKDFGEKYNLEIYRYGGDEFIITVTYPIAYDLLQTLTADLCRQIAELRIAFPQTPLGYITVGAGFIHTASQTDDKLEKLINKAYLAMRNAKKNGANQVSGL